MIKFENVCFSFGDKPVFENLTLTLPDRCVLIAPSGRGKTTLLRLAAGLLKPDSGKISGVPEKISFLFQDDRLLPWFSARKNIEAVLPRGHEDEVAGYLRAVELSEFAEKLPDELSGGQRRRVSLARALACGGDLLILDEPFKGLDEPLMRRMAELVLSSGSNFLAVSHSALEAGLLGGETVTLPK